ncbi:hypothetical protein AAHH67_23515 [Niallia circulans]
MKSIQSRLFFMLLAFIILPYFLTVLIIYGYTKDSVEQHELQNSKEQLDKLSKELEQYFNDMINLPYILYRNPDFFGFSLMAMKIPFILIQLLWKKILKLFPDAFRNPPNSFLFG